MTHPTLVPRSVLLVTRRSASDLTETELRELAKKTGYSRIGWDEYTREMLIAFVQNRPYLLPENQAAFHD